MVAQMTDDSIEYVCTGPEGRSGGLTRCTVSVRPGSYDHKRHAIIRSSGLTISGQQKLATWDFVLHRKDGPPAAFTPMGRQRP